MFKDGIYISYDVTCNNPVILTLFDLTPTFNLVQLGYEFEINY